jgi:Golgi phosphoprotein 3
MDDGHELRLHEEILLLALKDEKGTPAWGHYTYAMAGAILTELVLEERVRLEARRGRKKPLIDLVSATQIGDPILDDALRQVRTAKRRATAGTWVQRWARTRLLHDTARRLARRGILRIQQKRVLLLFSRRVYPELDPGPEERLIERMRQAIFGDSVVAPRTAAVIALAQVADLLKPVFGGRELKRRKQRLEQMAEGDLVAEATRAAVQAAAAAATAAATAATAAT